MDSAAEESEKVIWGSGLDGCAFKGVCDAMVEVVVGEELVEVETVEKLVEIGVAEEIGGGVAL